MPHSWSNIPSGSMRAVTLVSPGAQPPSSSLVLDPSYPKPTLPSDDWLLVRVRAVGLNRTDLRQRNNEPANPASFGPFIGEFHNDKPAVLGEECVGEVDIAGSNTGFEKGERVIGVFYGGGKAYDGCYAEHTLIRKDVCHRLPAPDKLSIGEGSGQTPWTTLASFPCSGWTAWASLFQSATTLPGSTVLIRGSTSSVGVWAVLLAKARDCTVIATTRQASKLAKLKTIGADHVVVEGSKDGAPDVQAMIRDVLSFVPKGAETVIDLVDPSSFASFGFKVCANYGTVVPTGILGTGYAPAPFTPPMIPSTKRLGFHGGFAVTDQLNECFTDLALGISHGKYKVEHFLEMVFELEEVGRAHDIMERNELCGKAVLRVS
ncbi:MAG: hypothetical protein Q9159_000232 [Coniocarpon cinnabarinum]